MPGPAARISDMTEHGGNIVVGCPTVLIGGMPAARVGDNHVCPMVTGVVPHVGGPIVLGSFGVLTGNMPQARVGDLCVCVGPPDVITKGEPTVIVGEIQPGGPVAPPVIVMTPAAGTMPPPAKASAGTPQGHTMSAAKRAAAPFTKKCPFQK